MSTSILIVEDDPSLAELVRYNLAKEGFNAVVVGDGETAVVAVEEEDPSLVILDWMLPNLSGIEVCRQLRRKPENRNLPIIMLTARGEEADRIRGLDSGADDYVVKPFSPNELIARVRAVLRRAHPEESGEVLSYADLTMDLEEHRVYRGDEQVRLGPTEFRLLRVFLEKPGRVYSREQLLDRVWGRDIYVESRTVDVHIRRLRKALNSEGRPDLIRTVRSAGYALDSSPD
ncbi:MAG: phosphate regulon transcriptional regulatory protein PhoB [Rhodospirillales bacterium CG15_BIG_FIL_POST_REV_8_21_14_020_66_15]|nr:MAG: phosphate regulon transcriptional regulatory protein PhoB [Rhodospirillales bacterium CG15_BIG_FIL_POST_REV_8_21_14_020_66_15]